MSEKAYILGQGVLGLHLAYHLNQQGTAVTIVDRNDPFELRPEKKTSAAAIGVIEPSDFGWNSREYFKRTRDHYLSMIAEGHDFLRHSRVHYLSNELEDLDGPEEHIEEEQYRKIDPEQEGYSGFEFGEEFQAIFVNTNLYNWWLSEKLIELGVKFVQKEIEGAPAEVQVDEKKAKLVFDCRGYGLKHTEAGSKLIPVSGQTFVLHAPEGVDFEGIAGHLGAKCSYNIVPWMKVTEANLAKIPLDVEIDPKAGGTLVLIGASKDLGDESWQIDPSREEEFIKGAAAIDPRVREWRVVATRKGIRARLSGGVAETMIRDKGSVVISLLGWAGVAYCASWAYCEDLAKRTLEDATNQDIWKG